MDVFFTDGDWAEYLRLMAEDGRAAGLSFVGWCLMTNHVHLIAVPEGASSLARGVGEAHRRYTRFVNFG
jgi:putative transposase